MILVNLLPIPQKAASLSSAKLSASATLPDGASFFCAAKASSSGNQFLMPSDHGFLRFHLGTESGVESRDVSINEELENKSRQMWSDICMV